VTDDGSVSDTGDRDPALVVDSVARRFGDLTVLSDVSFSLSGGEVACVVGPNGSGKTTLLRVVAGLLAPTAGRVDRRASAGDGVRSVGYLPQTPAYRPQFTLAETLAFYADLAGVTVDPGDVLDRVGLAAVADRRVEALSGGMSRLFGIAVATVGDPPLLVLDEPSSGLDPVMNEHVGTVVTDLAAGEATVLLATHDMATVDRVADTVLVLDGGEIAAAGSPETLRDRTGADTLTGAVSALVTSESGELTVRSGSRGVEQ
jgi:ABC-type multidrug transport system ATPase subunit